MIACQQLAHGGVSRYLYAILCAVVPLFAQLLLADEPPVDAWVTRQIQWVVQGEYAAEELALEGIPLPEWYGNTWPDSVRVRVGINSISGDTLAIRYDDWSTRQRGLPIAEVEP